MKKKRSVIYRQWNGVLHAEERELSGKPPTRLAESFARAGDRVCAVVPKKALELLKAGFAKSFALMLDKGDLYIEKICSSDKRTAAYDKIMRSSRGGPTACALRRVDFNAWRSAKAGQGMAAAHGAALGLLGIGVPDIPLTVGTLLKTVYSVGLDYGFSHETGDEKIFAVQVICAASSREDKRVFRSALVDRIGAGIDAGEPCGVTPEESVKAAADALCEAMLTAKAVQTLPLIGVVGGAANGIMSGRIGRMARIKYKKRFLRRAEGQL